MSKKEKSNRSVKDLINGETIDLSNHTSTDKIAFLDIRLGGVEIRVQFLTE